MKIFKLAIIFFLLLMASFNGHSQEKKSRPKIGVVLSGGGAKGIAHIGILKALEEEGIRPDFIVGTSMGSIIGGLYSIGYSADQLDSIIKEIDWDLVLSNNIPYNYISFEEKEYYNRFLVSLSFKDGKLEIPSGMIEGQMLGQVLNRYAWPAMKYDNFDEFPIPFRCVATDVSTGEPIVFKDGSLAEALRASMAIPTVFTAADLDTTLAVDGGILDNFPVDVVLKMGADYVIGVNVSDEGLEKAKDIGSMTGILMQVAMFPSLKKVKDDISKCDIYIKPDLKNYSTGSFSSYKEILKLGYVAGEKARPEFHELAKKLKEQSPPPSGVTLSVKPIYISNIILRGNRHVSEKLIYGKLGIKAGETVSRKKIETGINQIYGINAFKKVGYQIEKLPNEDKYNLIVQVHEEQPAAIKASVHYDNLFSAGIVVNTTLRNLLGKSSRMIAETDISQSPKVLFSYLKYLGKKQRVAGLIRYNFMNEQVPEYENGKLSDIGTSTYNEFLGGILLTQSLKNSFMAGVKYKTGKEKLKFWNNFPEGINNMRINQFIGEMTYDYNTLNDRNYPTGGTEVAVFADVYFNSYYSINFDDGVDTIYINDPDLGDVPLTEKDFNEYIVNPLIPNSYARFQFKYYEYIRVRPSFQIIPTAQLGMTMSDVDEGLFDNFRIGGIQMVHADDVPFMGLNYSEISDENFLSAGLFLQNIFFRNIFLKYGINYLLHHEYVPLSDFSQFDFNSDNNLFGFGLELTYKSILGPVSVGLSSNSTDKKARWYISIGYSLNYKD